MKSPYTITSKRNLMFTMALGSSQQTFSLAKRYLKPNFIKLKVAFLLSFFLCSVSFAQTVSTFAGNGNAAIVNGPVASASFNAPQGMAKDASGNLYVADRFNHCIRKITPTGVVSTFAGSGVFGDADGTTATAQFSIPSGIAVDNATGNVYVTDTYNDRIRKITPAGQVTTIAARGMPDANGTVDIYNVPWGIVVDGSGNLFVACTDYRILKIVPTGATAVVSTFAGTGYGYADGPGLTTAKFHALIGMAIDASNNLYVTEYYDAHRVRKITPAGVVSTIAGSSTAGSADGIGTAATFNFPNQLTVDASGNIYVCDGVNHKIRKITPAGVVSTLAGSGVAGFAEGIGTAAMFNAPTGICFDSDNNLLVSDNGNHRIRKIALPPPANQLNFDGTNDYVALPATANNIPAGNSNYTIEAWINPAQFGPKHIVAWGDYGQNYRVNGFRLNLNGANPGLTNYWVGADLTVNYPFVANTWYHVAVTYDGTNRKIYVNGVIPTGGQDIPPANTHNVGTTSNVTIGVIGSLAASTYFKGGMDEVRIWSVARTAAQINASKNCELQGNETGLVTYYKFNHGFSAQDNTAITTLTNAVSGAPNGTLTNFARTGTTSNFLTGSPVTTGSVIPPAPTASAQAFCGIATVANLVPALSANIKWYSLANASTPLLSTDTLKTGTYYVDSTNSNGCTGARTSVSVTVAAIASGNLTQTLPVTGTTYFSNACSSNLIAKLNPNGASPISGSTTAKVWVEATQPAQFVKRHYEITPPAASASTATGNVTLYFTQAEFDAFNAVNTLKQLPANGADATGKANLVIEKRPGTSSNGTGLPNTYSGTAVTINPADGDIIWNAAQNRWEVSFNVTGFSGFFVKTQSFVLPVTIQSFNAIQQTNDVLVKWQTSNEVNVNLYEVEISTDGQRFNKIGTVAVNSTNSANSANDYAFVDKSVWASSVRYYRLKTIDNDGTIKYSAVVKLANKQQTVVAVYPNPVTNAFTIQLSDNKLLHTQAKLVDATGKTVKLITINTLMQTEEISNLPKGMYMLQLADGKVVKLIKN
jgi:sugar lactone lactonase YvrE